MSQSLSQLALQSEYVVSHLNCQIIETDQFNILRTPTEPNYYFGNLLSLKVPLHRYSRNQWQSHFQRAFADLPAVEHETYSWVRQDESLNESVLSEFKAANFKYDETHILTQQRSLFEQPRNLNSQLDYRILESDRDWQQWTEIEIQEKIHEHSEASLRVYLGGKEQNYRAMQHRGHGYFVGAFDGARLVGFAGLYHSNELARFQNVHVEAEYRNRGVAKTILSRLITDAPETVETMVIHADEHYHATRLYQSLGFAVHERVCDLCWWPEKPSR
jgi:GNAT superfamily N-acetyltransferase